MRQAHGGGSTIHCVRATMSEQRHKWRATLAFYINMLFACCQCLNADCCCMSPYNGTYSGKNAFCVNEAFLQANSELCVPLTGDQYWLYREVWPEPGYPRRVRELGATLPQDGIQAALRWEPLAKTYFFKGALYWRFSEERRTVDPGYPKPIGVWNGAPDGLQGAFISRHGGRFHITQTQTLKFKIDYLPPL